MTRPTRTTPITVRIPFSLLDRARLLAARLGCSVTGLIRDGLGRECARREREERAAARATMARSDLDAPETPPEG